MGFSYKTLLVSVFTKLAGPGVVRRLHKYHNGFLNYIFWILDTEDVPVEQIISCLAILLHKCENDVGKIIKKPHNFL